MTDTVPAAPAGAIVVGVDGSPSSLAALRWAYGMADSTGRRVDVIAVWQWPISLGMAIPLPSGYDPAADAQRMLEESVAPLITEFPEVACTTLTVEGHAGAALVAASDHAELLVVGSQGHNEVAGLVLGSVSQHCAAHANSSVLIHRHRDR